MPDKKAEVSVNLSKLAIALSVIAAVAGPFIRVGAGENRLMAAERTNEAQDQRIKTLWDVQSSTREMAIKHEAILPSVQQDVRDLKSDMTEVRKDIKEILRAVKS